jgi:hypothetical protein
MGHTVKGKEDADPSVVRRKKKFFFFEGYREASQRRKNMLSRTNISILESMLGFMERHTPSWKATQCTVPRCGIGVSGPEAIWADVNESVVFPVHHY